MHDLRAIREGLDALRRGMERRGKVDTLGPALDRLVELDRDRRLSIQALEERKAARNASSQEVARRKRAGEDATDLVAHGRALGEEIARLERELAETEAVLQATLAELPNVTLPEVPAGGEESNSVVRTWGMPREGGAAPHWEVGERLGVLDLARGSKVSGSGFVVLRGQAARLTRALMSFMIDLHVRENGYEEAWVPFVVNRASMFGTGQLPKFEEDMYGVDGGGSFLIPTAEVPITNLLRDELLDASQLPMGIVGYSPCFRREAGAAGKDTRGLIRVHQFDKVELVRFTTAEQSAEQHELLTAHAERVLQLLELPYRVVLLASGDTGFASAKTYDLEVWAPGVGKWLEVSSCSNFLDFQARRANIRYRPAPGEKPRFAHTLNGSGVAFPRTIIGLLEHHQQADGSIRIPAALRPYFGADHLR